MGDNLNTEVWRCIRVDGSTRDQLVLDVINAGGITTRGYDRIQILDALDELLATGDVRYGPDDRFRRGEPFESGPGRAAALGMASIEERLDMAWPRSGGRREIIRALADEVEEMHGELLELLRAASTEIVRIYDNSTGSHMDEELVRRIDGATRDT